MEKVRFGLIGIGAQGGAYAGFLTGQGGFPGMPAPQCPPHCALGALCDIDPEKEKMCREKYPDVPFFKDWKEMVASGTVDAVITTVPHYLHHEIAIYCLEHGMNVLVEKPAGVRAKDVMAMNKCAEEHPDVAFGIMFNQRTNKLYQKIKEIVASGELGEIRRSNWIINTWWRPDSYYQQSEWRATWGGEGGGVLVNQAPHQLDLWQWICGIPTKVTSKNINGSHRKIDVENDVTIVTEYANGATGSFITCTHDAIGTDEGRARGAHGHAGGVLAVHALQRHRLDGHVGIRARLVLLVADEVLRGQQVVLALAGHAARVAADAFLGVDEHSVTGHYAPTFLTVTTASCVHAPP